MDKIDLTLTKDQHKALLPFLKQVDAVAKTGKKGMIIGQFGVYTASVTFVPYEYAERLREIMKEMKEKDAQ